MGNYILFMIVQHVFAPWLVNMKCKMIKSIVIIIAPLLAEKVSTGICTYHALTNTRIIINNLEHSLVFVFLSRGIYFTFYSILQADFTSIWQFIGICLVRGFLRVAWIATKRLWVNRLEWQENNPNDHPRFMANMEIENMLFDCTITILSPVFVALCLKTNSAEISFQDLLNTDALFKIIIRLAIDVFFSFLHIFVLVRWYDIPVCSVWSTYRKYHVLVNVIIVVVISCMSKPFTTIYKNEYEEFNKNDNCTSVFAI